MKILFLIFFALSLQVFADKRPNILWIVVDDMSPHFGFNGEPLVNTPHVDKLAKEGIVYTNAYATAPVCSTFRTSLITGMYQTSIGGHHHRSGRGKLKISLPKGIKTIPEIFKEAGYHTSNGSASMNKYGKEDYNFSYKRSDLYDSTDWSGRKKGQAFFAQIQLRGGKIRNVDKWYSEAKAALKATVSPDQVKLPPYYPSVDAFKYDWATYLDSVNYTDLEVGRIISRLKKENLLDNTIIFFITDHGISQARGKQFCYEEGAKVPLVIWSPKKFKPEVRDDFVLHIDMAATAMNLAGIKIPEYMQSKNILDEKFTGRKYVVTARDRCDETVDRIRSVRMGDFKYIRNFYPKRPHLQPCNYKDKKPWMPVLRQLYADGKLNELQEKILFSPERPEEELYYLVNDKWELKNLAADPQYKDKLQEMRNILADWVKESDDQGRFPESEAQYDSDMLGPAKKSEQTRKNIQLMKKWKAEGK